MSIFIKKLKKLLTDSKGDVELYCISAVKNWPLVNLPLDEDYLEDEDEDEDEDKDEDKDEGKEPLDLENYEIIEINDTRLVINCGGDWQDPLKVTIELVDGALTVTKVEEILKYEEGITHEEFVAALQNKKE